MSTASSLQPSLVFHGVLTDSSPAPSSSSASAGSLICKLLPSPTNPHGVNVEDRMQLQIYPKSPYVFLRVTQHFSETWKPVLLSFTSFSRANTVHMLVEEALGTYDHHGKGQGYEFGLKVPGRAFMLNPSSLVDNCLKLQFERILPVPSPLSASDRVKAAESASTPYISLTNDKDVALIFPFEKTSSNSVLWANKAKLSALSTYFESMFTGGFTESQNILLETSQILEATKKDLSKVRMEERRKGRPADLFHGDSDIEEDDSMEQADDEAGLDAREAGASASIHYIPIRETSYKTYQGLLEWAYSGTIDYAPLKSTHPHSPSLMPSPKSIYRLAHQLGIKVLQDDAVANFQSQLNHQNVLEELFSSTCFIYPVLREAGLKVLDREWAKVKESGGLDNIFKLVESDQGDAKEMMKVALEILKRSQILSG